MKTCSKCDIAKPLSEFYATTKGGYRGKCKPCYLAENAKRREGTWNTEKSHARRIALPNIEELQAELEYRDGKLLRRKAMGNCKAGSEFGKIGPGGYKRACFHGTQYMVHRLIFKIMTGQEPSDVDHINGDRTDNRIENLRAVTFRQNMWNTKAGKTNKSGFNGIRWYDYPSNRMGARWVVTCTGTHGGYFKSLEDAVAAYEEHARRLNGKYAEQKIAHNWKALAERKAAGLPMDRP